MEKIKLITDKEQFLKQTKKLLAKIYTNERLMFSSTHGLIIQARGKYDETLGKKIKFLSFDIGELNYLVHRIEIYEKQGLYTILTGVVHKIRPESVEITLLPFLNKSNFYFNYALTILQEIKDNKMPYSSLKSLLIKTAHLSTKVPIVLLDIDKNISKGEMTEFVSALPLKHFISYYKTKNGWHILLKKDPYVLKQLYKDNLLLAINPEIEKYTEIIVSPHYIFPPHARKGGDIFINYKKLD